MSTMAHHKALSLLAKDLVVQRHKWAVAAWSDRTWWTAMVSELNSLRGLTEARQKRLLEEHYGND
jgi:hypothetical protein